MNVEFLNYHHLRYFWVVAREGSLRKASERLHVSQPTISAQIAALERSLDEKLFRRRPRGLVLTETGHQAFSYAEEIFALGRDLVDAVRQRPTTRPLRVSIGIADSLPKLVSHEIIKPVFSLGQPVHAVCFENKTSELLAQLAVYRLDIVLADEAAPSAFPLKAFNHLLGESGVTFCARRKLATRLRRSFPRSMHNEPMLLPTSSTALRRTLEKWFQEQGIHPRVVAEYDDAALMKVAASDGLGCFPLPTVVVEEAVERYGFEIVGPADGCAVQFHAITAERKLTHPAVMAVTSHARGVLLGGAVSHRASGGASRPKGP
ncbi:MAG TPA: LysR family transcriptional regulator [Verrucomicrobiota bacterium]|nr:LysR family transcriptional regulator [Verrucomicrobiota bacterium]HRZ38434.1 LysR family transcriptional regulator [Candidatus Paceibacterota bacterium]HRZ58213.1 LysR family transcriptional regulator [Candidatus Paceibacterota bacterium]